MLNALPALVVAPPVLAAAVIALHRPLRGVPGRLASSAATVSVLAAVALVIATITDADVGSGVLAAGRVTAVLALLTAAVGTIVLAFARRALAGDPAEHRWLALATLLVAATMVSALAASGTVLAVGWVATSVTLAGLIGHRRDWRRAMRARRRVIASLAVGDLALVAAVSIAGLTVGGVDLRRPALTAAELGAHDWAATPVAVLLVVAGISRSALVPLHRWLPATLVAPTPVSAILHAGVVNGAGILLLKAAPIGTASTVAMTVLFVAGVLTALLASSVMLVRADVKGALAWSTAGQMGFMTVQLAVGAFAAALFHIVGHALYKASSFLGSGSAVDAVTAERRLAPAPPPTVGRRLVSACVAAVAALSIVTATIVVAPNGSVAATLLVVVFGWVTTARLTHGWLMGAGPTSRALPVAAAAAVAAPWAYVGALTAFKGFVDTPALVAGGGVVGWQPLAAVIAAALVGAAVVAGLPGRRGVAVRRRLTGFLIGTATPAAPTPSSQPALRLVARPRRDRVVQADTDTDTDIDTAWRTTA